MTRFRFIAALLCLSATVASNADAGVVAHWNFEEGVAGAFATGTDSVLDVSGNNLHLTPLAGPTYTAFPGSGTNLGLRFDGVNDIARRADSSLFRLRNLTIEAFIRYDGGTSLDQIFFRGDARGGRDPIFLAVLNGKLRFNISDLTVDRSVTMADPIPIGQTLHVAATLDDVTDQMKIFVDGIEVASRSAAGMRPDVALFSNANIGVGGLSDGAAFAQHFRGVIDEVRLSDVALRPSQFLNANPSVNTVPEPSAYLMLAGIGIFAAFRRRIRRQTAVMGDRNNC